MTLKEKIAKKKTMFSLTTFLQKQADKKLSKLEFRAARRAAKKEDNKTVEVAAEHVHDENCTHDHKSEDLFIEAPASDLPKLYDELSAIGEKQ